MEEKEKKLVKWGWMRQARKGNPSAPDDEERSTICMQGEKKKKKKKNKGTL